MMKVVAWMYEMSIGCNRISKRIEYERYDQEKLSNTRVHYDAVETPLIAKTPALQELVEAVIEWEQLDSKFQPGNEKRLRAAAKAFKEASK